MLVFFASINQRVGWCFVQIFNCWWCGCSCCSASTNRCTPCWEGLRVNACGWWPCCRGVRSFRNRRTTNGWFFRYRKICWARCWWSRSRYRHDRTSCTLSCGGRSSAGSAYENWFLSGCLGYQTWSWTLNGQLLRCALGRSFRCASSCCLSLGWARCCWDVSYRLSCWHYPFSCCYSSSCSFNCCLPGSGCYNSLCRCYWSECYNFVFLCYRWKVRWASNGIFFS